MKISDARVIVITSYSIHYTKLYEHWVVRSAYDIVYKHVEGDQVPENKEAVLGSVVIKNPAVVDVDVEARLFGAPVYHNGVLFPSYNFV